MAREMVTVAAVVVLTVVVVVRLGHHHLVGVADVTSTVDLLGVEIPITLAASGEEAVATTDDVGHGADLHQSNRRDLVQPLGPPALTVVDADLGTRSGPEAALPSREKTTTDLFAGDLLPKTGSHLLPSGVVTLHLAVVLQVVLDPAQRLGERGPAHDRHPAQLLDPAALHHAEDVPQVTAAVVAVVQAEDEADEDPVAAGRRPNRRVTRADYHAIAVEVQAAVEAREAEQEGEATRNRADLTHPPSHLATVQETRRLMFPIAKTELPPEPRHHHHQLTKIPPSPRQPSRMPHRRYASLLD